MAAHIQASQHVRIDAMLEPAQFFFEFVLSAPILVTP